MEYFIRRYYTNKKKTSCRRQNRSINKGHTLPVRMEERMHEAGR